jgi:hypothetical protein
MAPPPLFEVQTAWQDASAYLETSTRSSECVDPVGPVSRVARQHPTPLQDRPLQRLEILRVELLPRLAGDLVKPNAVHRGDHQAPAFDNLEEARGSGGR